MIDSAKLDLSIDQYYLTMDILHYVERERELSTGFGVILVFSIGGNHLGYHV